MFCSYCGNKTDDGNDGTGWKITSFDSNGSVIGKIVGYIHNDSTFDTLLEIIGEK